MNGRKYIQNQSPLVLTRSDAYFYDHLSLFCLSEIPTHAPIRKYAHTFTLTEGKKHANEKKKIAVTEHQIFNDRWLYWPYSHPDFETVEVNIH